jgi:hypothetical protein
MRKTTAIISGLVVAVIVAAAAFAANGPSATNAAKACKAERTAMGEQSFKLLYGTNANRANAFGKCVSKHVRAEQKAVMNASQTCRAERDTLGEVAFNAKYGKNRNDRNAFGKCVSQQAKAELADQQEATIKAAKACKAERASLGALAFRTKYGSNHNKANAFGKCVSKRVHA